MCNRNVITIPYEEDMSKYSILHQVGGELSIFKKSIHNIQCSHLIVKRITTNINA